jgi:hypothetical protein
MFSGDDSVLRLFSNTSIHGYFVGIRSVNSHINAAYSRDNVIKNAEILQSHV